LDAAWLLGAASKYLQEQQVAAAQWQQREAEGLALARAREVAARLQASWPQQARRISMARALALAHQPPSPLP